MPPINEWMGLGGGIYYGDKTMGKNFELNQILAISFRSHAVAIGKVVEYSDDKIEIFDPELALIGKLEKIPIMRSLSMILNQIPDIMISLQNDTGNIELKWLLQLFNDSKYNDPEFPGAVPFNSKKPNLIGIASRYAYSKETSSGAGEAIGIAYETLNFNMQYQGGIPLKPSLCLRNELGFSNVVAGTSWPVGGAGHGMIFIEIDWKTVSKAEFEEYILEYIYAQGL